MELRPDRSSIDPPPIDAPPSEEFLNQRGTAIDGWSGWSKGKTFLAVVVAASFGLWAYAYSGLADRAAPDTFDDPSFARQAERICAEAKDAYDRLPNSLSAADEHERAAQLRTANAILDTMVTDLEREAATMDGTDRDRGIADLWLRRWRLLLADRIDYAERLDQDPEALFYISQEAGFRAEKSINYVADVNRMSSCGLPTDVG